MGQCGNIREFLLRHAKGPRMSITCINLSVSRCLPLPAASSKGGSPQWSDSFRGAPCTALPRE